MFVLAITFQSSLAIAGNTRSLPKKEASERCSNWVGSGLALKLRLDYKVIARYNHSSLLGLVVSNEGKSFITLTPGDESGKSDRYPYSGPNIIKLFTALSHKCL